MRSEMRRNGRRGRLAVVMILAVAVALAASLLTAEPVLAAEETSGQAKYVILLIGDGMGLAQRTAAEIYQSSPQGRNKPVTLKLLTMNTLPAMGLARTQCYDNYITDSGAAGTALACGEKTLRAVIGMDHTDRRLTSLAEVAKQRRWKVGVVSTAFIEDATPAVFYAHEHGRGSYYDIAMQLAASGVDYFAGGGSEAEKPLVRLDRPSPVEAAKANGFNIVTSKNDFAALKPGGKVWAMFPASSLDPEMAYEIDRPADCPSLAELTRKGIELLDNPTGFFMMVEGGKIDHACHAHDLATAIREVLAFDQAVAEALAFYKKHPTETLIVVTADHETGGLGLGSTRGNYELLPKLVAAQKGSYEAFTLQVAEFRQNKTGFEQALPAITAFFGFENLSPLQTRQLAAAYEESMIDPLARTKSEEKSGLYNRNEPLTVACLNIMARQCGMGFTTWSHSGLPVPVSAIGVGQERFNGYRDNTEVSRSILAVMGGPVAAPAAAPAAK